MHFNPKFNHQFAYQLKYTFLLQSSDVYEMNAMKERPNKHWMHWIICIACTGYIDLYESSGDICHLCDLLSIHGGTKLGKGGLCHSRTPRGSTHKLNRLLAPHVLG